MGQRLFKQRVAWSPRHREHRLYRPDGLNLHSVGWIGDENWQFFSHADLGQSELTVEVAPELGLEGLSGELGQCDGVHANSGHHLIGGQELFGFCEVVSETGLSHDEWSNVEGSLSAQELDGGVRVSLSNFTSVNGFSDLGLKSVVSIELPNSLEVRLVRNPLAHLVRVLHLVHLDDFRGQLAKSLPLGFEGSSALLSGGVHAEHDLLVLVSTSE